MKLFSFLHLACPLVALLFPSTSPAETAFDLAQCPDPLLVVQDGRATMVYDPELLGTLPARAGRVPVLERGAGKVWYYDPTQTSLMDILTRHGARITDHHGPVECAMTAAGFPNPTRRAIEELGHLPWDRIGATLPGGSAKGGIEAGQQNDAPAPDTPTPLSATASCQDGPRSGTWSAEIGATRMEGCPAIMQQMFTHSPGLLPEIAAPPGKLDFACPFHPDSLELSRTARVKWQSNGPGSWVTTDLAATEFAMIPAGQGGGSHIRWQLDLRSPEELTFERSIEIILPAEASALLGTAPGGCRVTGTDRWIRLGD